MTQAAPNQVNNGPEVGRKVELRLASSGLHNQTEPSQKDSRLKQFYFKKLSLRSR